MLTAWPRSCLKNEEGSGVERRCTLWEELTSGPNSTDSLSTPFPFTLLEIRDW